MRRSHGTALETRRRNIRRALLIITGLLTEVVPLRRRGYGFGRSVIVRCRRGHLFTTIWLPAVSVKSVRLGSWRFQRCPVGNHWSLVTPVRRAELTDADREAATATK